MTLITSTKMITCERAEKQNKLQELLDRFTESGCRWALADIGTDYENVWSAYTTLRVASLIHGDVIIRKSGEVIILIEKTYGESY